MMFTRADKNFKIMLFLFSTALADTAEKCLVVVNNLSNTTSVLVTFNHRRLDALSDAIERIKNWTSIRAFGWIKSFRIQWHCMNSKSRNQANQSNENNEKFHFDENLTGRSISTLKFQNDSQGFYRFIFKD